MPRLFGDIGADTEKGMGTAVKKIKGLINRETIMYLIFGVLTTAVNYLVLWVFMGILGADMTLVANAIAFVAAVIFAFVTNKLFVFESKSWAPARLRLEIPGFVSGRLLSFGVEEAGLLVCTLLGVQGTQLLGINGMMIAKAALSVIVVVLNYFFGKIVFRRGQKPKNNG